MRILLIIKEDFDDVKNIGVHGRKMNWMWSSNNSNTVVVRVHIILIGWYASFYEIVILTKQDASVIAYFEERLFTLFPT